MFSKSLEQQTASSNESQGTLISKQVFGFLFTFFFKHVVSFQLVFSWSLDTHNSNSKYWKQCKSKQPCNDYFSCRLWTTKCTLNEQAASVRAVTCQKTHGMPHELSGTDLQGSSVFCASHPYFEQLRVNYLTQWIPMILVWLVPIKSFCFSTTGFYQPESLAGFKFKLYLSRPLWGSLQMIGLIPNGFTSFRMNSYTFSCCHTQTC